MNKYFASSRYSICVNLHITCLCRAICSQMCTAYCIYIISNQQLLDFPHPHPKQNAIQSHHWTSTLPLALNEDCVTRIDVLSPSMRTNSTATMNNIPTLSEIPANSSSSSNSAQCCQLRVLDSVAAQEWRLIEIHFCPCLFVSLPSTTQSSRANIPIGNCNCWWMNNAKNWTEAAFTHQ